MLLHNLVVDRSNLFLLMSFLQNAFDAVQSQPQQQIPRAPPSTSAVNRQEPVRSQPHNDEPPSPTSITSSSHNQKDNTEATGPSDVPKAAPPVLTLSHLRTSTSSQSSSHSGPIEAEAARNEETPPTDYVIIDPPPTEIPMEDNETLSSLLRRLRLRRGHSAPEQ